MRKFNYILFLMSLLLCAVILFGCADAPPVGEEPAGDLIESAKPKDRDSKNDKEQTTENATDTEAQPQDTTSVPEETTAKPVDTTAVPEETTAKPVVTDPPANITKVEKPSDELIKRIEDDYTALAMKDNSYDPEIDGIYPVVSYYGKIGDLVPVMFKQPEDGAIRAIEIAGSVFHYGGSNFIKIWKDGEFFTVEEAYQKGFLTKEQIAILADIHNTGKYYIVQQ